MNFNFTDEQVALQDTLRKYIAKDYSFEQRRALAKSELGFSRDHWKQFAELGLLALPFAEDAGGLGGTPVDTMIVMDALGRGLVLEPYLTTVVLCGGIVAQAGSATQKDEIIAAIAGGERLMALAHFEGGQRYALDNVSTTARRDGDGVRLDGKKAVVLNGASADQFIVSAREGAGVSLFLVDAKSAGLTVRGYKTQDGARAADLALEGVRVSSNARLGAEGQGLPIIARALAVANAALCAEAVGIMLALNETTLEYLKTRKQFGQPIGRFQALQHRMVDMVIAAEQARSMALLAAVKMGGTDADASHIVDGARAYIGQQARFVGQQAVQLHGGMGVVDELIVGHYFKRLTLITLTFGDTDHYLARYSDELVPATARTVASAHALAAE